MSKKILMAAFLFPALLWLTGCPGECKKTQESAADGGQDAVNEVVWLSNFETAKKTAAAEGKPILMVFSGSDWCHFCIELKKNVFDKDEFKKYADDNLVLLLIDFPRNTVLDKELREQNEKLAMQFRLEGVPTVYLLDSEGNPSGKVDYLQDDAASYVAKIRKMVPKTAK